MNLDHDFFLVSKLSEEQKPKPPNSGEDKKKGLHQKLEHFISPNSGEDQKKVFTKNGTLFSSNSSGDLRSDAHQSQIIGGDADEDHTQIIGGIYPPEFRHPCRYHYKKGVPYRTAILAFNYSEL